ncbi:unnamed protein product [Closterium sp. NIES-65]|nr:unnamed protein product [Closterium sp. NIES-65]
MYIALYFIVTRLPDSLSAVRDLLLTLDPRDLTAREARVVGVATVEAVVEAVEVAVVAEGVVVGVEAFVAAVVAAVGVVAAAVVAAVGVVAAAVVTLGVEPVIGEVLAVVAAASVRDLYTSAAS